MSKWELPAECVKAKDPEGMITKTLGISRTILLSSARRLTAQTDRQPFLFADEQQSPASRSHVGHSREDETMDEQPHRRRRNKFLIDYPLKNVTVGRRFGGVPRGEGR